MRLSVIIANYNYRDFVGAAIESALAIDWHDTEVIVVDDASTDDSRTVIERFGDRITAHFRPKAYQFGAHRFGFEQSTGDVVILLDADDLLEPEVMKEVAAVWRPGVSKVQFRMALINAEGAQLGTAIPQFPSRENPEKLRRVYLRTMSYTSSFGSGNAYAREFAQQVFAMVSAGILQGAMQISDTPLCTLAPLFGDVVTIRKPLARYRIHSANNGALSWLDPTKLRKELMQDVDRVRWFSDTCRQLSLPIAREPLLVSITHLQFRFASYLVDPAAHPFMGDTMLKLASRLARSIISYSQMPLRNRAILLAWVLACAGTPKAYRNALILWRFSAFRRPKLVKGVLDVFSSLRSPRLPDRHQLTRPDARVQLGAVGHRDHVSETALRQ
jgi:hypothetical protein